MSDEKPSTIAALYVRLREKDAELAALREKLDAMALDGLKQAALVHKELAALRMVAARAKSFRYRRFSEEALSLDAALAAWEALR